jgi:hypothetical protein
MHRVRELVVRVYRTWKEGMPEGLAQYQAKPAPASKTAGMSFEQINASK